MKGMILKDFLVAKSQAKIYLLLGVFYTILGFAQGTPAFFSGFVVIIAMMIPISSFSYDQLARWDSFAVSTPATRRDVVRAKYLFALAIMGVSVVLCVIIGLVGAMIKGDMLMLGDLLASVAGCAFAGLMLNFLLFPLVFRFGVEKARVGLMVIMVAIFGGAMTYNFMVGDKDIPFQINGFAIIVTALVLLVVSAIVSYQLSQRIYAKKEM